MQTIGILTLAFTANDNYGAFMQAWALRCALYKRAAVLRLDLKAGTVSYTDLSAYKVAKSRSNEVLYLQDLRHRPLNKKAALQRFATDIKRLRLFEKEARDLLVNYNKEQDGPLKFVVGSDWVWFFTQNRPPSPILFGRIQNCEEIPLYAYAASFGSACPQDAAYPKYRDFILKSLARFRLITLRESPWVEELNAVKLSCPKVSVVLDPALLCDKDDYKEIAAKPLCSEPYILLYAFGLERGTSESSLMKFLTALKSLKERFAITKVIDISPFKLFITPSLKQIFDALKLDYVHNPACAPQSFVNLIAHSQFTLTNSFHGMVYSLIFGKPFAYGYVRNQDPRIILLERIFNISSLLLDNQENINAQTIVQASQEVQRIFGQRIDSFRRDSFAVLDQILQDKP